MTNTEASHYSLTCESGHGAMLPPPPRSKPDATAATAAAGTTEGRIHANEGHKGLEALSRLLAYG